MDNFIINKEIITDFCNKNLSTHTDWTGTRVETNFKCESIDEFIDIFMDFIKNNQV